MTGTLENIRITTAARRGYAARCRFAFIRERRSAWEPGAN